MYALEGGSIGFQIGGQATDLVLLIMNNRGASSILNSKVKLGADASVAAGPVGRDAAANTDAYMRAEVLSYSRSRGLFAGISLEGSTLRPDDDATADIYGRKLTARDIVLGGGHRFLNPAGSWSPCCRKLHLEMSRRSPRATKGRVQSREKAGCETRFERGRPLPGQEKRESARAGHRNAHLSRRGPCDGITSPRSGKSCGEFLR